MTLGIIAALPQEIAELLAQMGEHMVQHTIGKRTFYQGKIGNQECIIVLARVGKVAASSTCTVLIQHFGVKQIIFTGLAGAVSPEVNIGDMVIGTCFCQHDLSAEPLFPRYEVPLLGKAYFSSDSILNSVLAQSCTDFLNENDALSASQMISKEAAQAFALNQMRLHQDLIVSGDQFISSDEAVQDLQNRFPDALCTEMEGAAVAQVCDEYDIPFAVMRVISDKANHVASIDFERFLNDVARFISSGVLLRLLQKI